MMAKAILWLAVVAAMAAMGWRVSAWRAAYQELPEVRTALVDEKECNEGSACADRMLKFQAEQDAVNLEVATRHAEQVAEIARRPPAPSVRLCRERSEGGVSGTASSGATDATTTPGDVQVEASSDIGQRLFDLADDADMEAVRLRNLQDWNRALAAQE